MNSTGLALAMTAGALISWSITDGYYQRKIDRLNSEIALIDKANADYKRSVAQQNDANSALNEYAAQRANEYAELLKRPQAIRYREVKSDECKDVIAIIDDIRSSGF